MEQEAGSVNFLALLQDEAATFNRLISMENGDWIVKGFVDIFHKETTDELLTVRNSACGGASDQMSGHQNKAGAIYF